MNWDDIVGHKRQVQVLRAVTERRRSAHAYLFVGESGVGKATVARAMARTLLCEASEGSERPCGNCRSCSTPIADHPDFFPVTLSGSSIKIEQIRAIQHELSYRPVWQQRKVFCIDPADAMTEQAQNALLKSLEEPPDFVSFILVSEHANAVLPTVRSRCVQIRFSRVAAQDIADALIARGVDNEQAALLAALSFGRPGAVIDSDVEQLLAQRRIVIEWAEHLFRRSSGIWYVGEACEKESERAPQLIDLLIVWFRDLFLVRNGRTDAVVNRDVLNLLEQSAEKVTSHGLTQAVTALLRLKENWEQNANFRLALDVALINIQRGLRSA